jgi:DNA-binding transcriptional regulator GbsR (MarR family)
MKPLSESERQIVETIGDFIKFWGFSKHHGRIWALLYISEVPLNSRDIQSHLEMSSGLVSMSIKELLHWDVLLKVSIPRDRKDYYRANADVWHMITKVMREREYQLIQMSMRGLDDALGEIETDEAVSPERLAYLKPRLEALIELAETFATFLSMLLNQAEANIQDLRRIMGNLPE